MPCDVTMSVRRDDVDMSNEINENLANERLEQSRDLISRCQGRHGDSSVEILVSADKYGHCGRILVHEICESA